jgi:large subunit ribosomal protein L21
MYAVVEAGGRQYQLTSGRFIDVEMVSGEPEQEFVFDRVLMIVNGNDSMIGKPLVEGAKVSGRIVSHGRDKKIVVYKYRAKKGTRKRTGHRQHFTRIYIDAIKVNDKVLSEAKDTGKPAKREKAEAVEKAAPKAEKAEKAPAKKAAPKSSPKPAPKAEKTETKAPAKKPATKKSEK